MPVSFNETFVCVVNYLHGLYLQDAQMPVKLAIDLTLLALNSEKSLLEI